MVTTCSFFTVTVSEKRYCVSPEIIIIWGYFSQEMETVITTFVRSIQYAAVTWIFHWRFFSLSIVSWQSAHVEWNTAIVNVLHFDLMAGTTAWSWFSYYVWDFFPVTERKIERKHDKEKVSRAKLYWELASWRKEIISRSSPAHSFSCGIMQKRKIFRPIVNRLTA